MMKPIGNKAAVPTQGTELQYYAFFYPILLLMNTLVLIQFGINKPY